MPEIPVLPAAPPEGGGPLSIRFLSPCRILSQGRTLGNFQARPVATSILRRYSALNALQGDGMPALDFKAWADACDNKDPHNNRTTPMRVTRYSNRQQRKHDLHGFTGEVVFERCPAALVQLLQLGDILQVGKSTAFGFGVTETVLPDPGR